MDPAHLKKITQVSENARTRYHEFWKNKKKHVRVRKKAWSNSVERHGLRGAARRKRIAEDLYKFRALDKAGVWGRSFNAGLKELSEYWYNLDLAKEVMGQVLKSKEGFHVLEVGCGGGKAASDLFTQLEGKIKVSALGLARIPSWDTYSNSKKINWHVGDVARLSLMKGFSPESVDFIHSNIGIGHSPEPYRSLQQVHKVLKKGGKVLFTYDGSEKLSIPKGFKFIRGFSNGYKKNPMYAQLKTYYLEKV